MSKRTTARARTQARPHSAAGAAAAAADAAAAIEAGRHREAIEHFKIALRFESRASWRAGLTAAYTGRARELAAKGMYREAEIVLANTEDRDGRVADPGLQALCLIKQGKRDAARRALAACGDGDGSCAPGVRAAALCLELAAGLDPDAPPAIAGDAGPAAAALATWQSGAAPDEVDRAVRQISPSSAAAPVRLLIKGLAAQGDDPARSATLFDKIAADGATGRLAGLAALAVDDAASVLGRWLTLTAAERALVSELRGVAPAAATLLTELIDAQRRGADALLAVIVKRRGGLPFPAARAACLDLLPLAPNRRASVERAFGALTEVDARRIDALAAEQAGDDLDAEQHWLGVATALTRTGGPEAAAQRAAVYRHLADRARRSEMAGESWSETNRDPAAGQTNESSDPLARYLARALDADPDDRDSLIALLDRLRAIPDPKVWGVWIAVGLDRFPDDGAILAHAVDEAVHRKAFKHATRWAARWVAVDPINPKARDRLIALHMAHARKQMRNHRPDLARKELAAAREQVPTDRTVSALAVAEHLAAAAGPPPDTPQLSGKPGTARGRHRRGGAAAPEIDLTRLAASIGNGPIAWLEIALEADRMGLARLRGLDQAFADLNKRRPDARELLGVADLFAAPDPTDQTARGARLLTRIEPWLRCGADVAWRRDEFDRMAELFLTFKLHRMLDRYAAAAIRREPADPRYRAYRVLAQIATAPRAADDEDWEAVDDHLETARRSGDLVIVQRLTRLVSEGAAHRRRQALAFDDDDIHELTEVKIDLLIGLILAADEALRDRIAGLDRDRAIAALIDRLRSLGMPVKDDDLQPLVRARCAAAIDRFLSGDGRTGPRLPGRARHERRAAL